MGGQGRGVGRGNWGTDGRASTDESISVIQRNLSKETNNETRDKLVWGKGKEIAHSREEVSKRREHTTATAFKKKSLIGGGT